MYRTCDTATWTDPKVKSLPPAGKLLFVYLFTNSHSHVSGIYYLPTITIVHETGLKQKDVDTLLHTLSSAGLAHYDAETEVIWVVKMLDRQGRGRKNAASAAAQLRSLHKCRLIKDFLQFYSHREIPYTIGYPTQVQDALPVPVPVLGSTIDPTIDNSKPEVVRTSKRFEPPTVMEVTAYCLERKNGIDPEAFFAFYDARGWTYGPGKPMKSWRSAVVTWEKNSHQRVAAKSEPEPYDFSFTPRPRDD